MSLRAKVKALDDSIDQVQRKMLRSSIDDAWPEYLALVKNAQTLAEDEDGTFALLVLQFVIALPKDDSFKDTLNAKQLEIVQSIEDHLRDLMGY